MQAFFQNGDEQVNGDGAPDLSAHGVRTRTVEGFDAQMLLDPFEEQFDLPAAMIQLRNGQGGRGEIVGQKDQRLAGLGRMHLDTVLNLTARLRSNLGCDGRLRGP